MTDPRWEEGNQYTDQDLTIDIGRLRKKLLAALLRKDMTPDTRALVSEAIRIANDIYQEVWTP